MRAGTFLTGCWRPCCGTPVRRDFACGRFMTCSGRNPQQREARRISHLLEVQQVLRRVGELGVDVLYVPGNHDRPDLGYSGNIDGRTARVGTLTVGGSVGQVRIGWGFRTNGPRMRFVTAGRWMSMCWCPIVLRCHRLLIESPGRPCGQSGDS